LCSLIWSETVRGIWILMELLTINV
jgi:hypothetical protein